MKSILIAVLCCIATFFGLEYVFEHVYSFEVWIGMPHPLLPLLDMAELSDADYAALLTSLFFTFAVIGLMGARRASLTTTSWNIGTTKSPAAWSSTARASHSHRARSGAECA